MSARSPLVQVRTRGEARWTTVNEFRGELLRLWARGELLRPLVTEETVPPRRLGFKGLADPPGDPRSGNPQAQHR